MEGELVETGVAAAEGEVRLSSRRARDGHTPPHGGWTHGTVRCKRSGMEVEVLDEKHLGRN